MNRKGHWESIYSTTATPSLSWYQRHAHRSLDFIKRIGLSRNAKILDVGGGDSLLVDDLLGMGYNDITVLDVSAAALNRARSRLGQAATGRVTWLESDITEADLRSQEFDIWHDRAVFHFLTTPAERNAYIASVQRAVRPGGHVVVATFAEDGPTRCSGLPVERYSAVELHETFGSDFQLVRSEREIHRTPAGLDQQFTYCWCRYDRSAVRKANY
jgi:ubiquinone/menaquinone biosynthesis C-methylase UbiE